MTKETKNILKHFTVDNIKSLRHPTMSESVKGGILVLVIAIIGAIVISGFDLGVSSIIGLFV